VTRGARLAVERDVKWPTKNIGTHAGRRTAATYLIDCKVDIGTVQDILGRQDAD
jgi:integrase